MVWWLDEQSHRCRDCNHVLAWLVWAKEGSKKVYFEQIQRKEYKVE